MIVRNNEKTNPKRFVFLMAWCLVVKFKSVQSFDALFDEFV